MTKFTINKLILNTRHAPYVFGLGLICLAVGIAVLYIEQNLSFTSIVLLGLSGLLLASLLLSTLVAQIKTPNLSSHSNSNGLPKLVRIIAIFILSVVFIGASQYLATSSDVRWDITQSKQHTLSNSSIEFLSTLRKPVQLSAFYVGTPPKYLEDLLKEYERVSAGLISAEIIDPIEQIAYATKFGNAINSSERKVFVESGTNRREVDFSNNPLSEEQLNNTIARANSGTKKVYFLSGHGEYSPSSEDLTGLSTFAQLLANNNIQSELLMLGISQTIPLDCDVLIIAGPKTHLTISEESIINDYLAKGGDALFLVEHTLVSTPSKPLSTAQLLLNPSLNGLLSQWGLEVQADIVVDLSNHVGDDVGSPATKNYESHKAITEGLDYTFYVRPRSIRVLPKRRTSIKLAVIASTSSVDSSWAETNRNLAIEFNPASDTPGPVAFSYVVMEEQSSTNELEKTSDTRLIVFTDADFLSNVYIDQYSNAQMGINLVNWLAETDYKAYPSIKKISVERLDLTSKQKRQVLSILVLLPLLLLILGLVVWRKTRTHN